MLSTHLMSAEPAAKRAVAFIDGQNLFYAVKEAFGYTFPNYDAGQLAAAICISKGWQLNATRFYTGIPDARDNAFWNHFWTAKLAQMGRQGIRTFSRPLRYQNRVITLPSGKQVAARVGQEKGIDIRLALDIVRLAFEAACDVALVFSQDQDLSEVADEIRLISIREKRWLKVASAFPSSPTYPNTRGINRTEWIPFDQVIYDPCIDPRDYRPKKPVL